MAYFNSGSSELQLIAAILMGDERAVSAYVALKSLEKPSGGAIRAIWLFASLPENRTSYELACDELINCQLTQ